MSKIYSRPRLRLPKINLKPIRSSSRNMINEINFKSDVIRKLVKIILILIIAFSTVKLVLDAVLPIFDNLCENRAKSIATIVSNEQVTNVMREHSYDELFSIEKDNNGNITMIKANIIPINEIISDVANKIQEDLNNKGRENIEIALGSFTGVKLLAGRGPGIKIRISSIGNVETDLRSEFTQQGINQTLHRVYLYVNCQVNILTPFDNITKDVTNQVLLAESVIVGNIPDTYYNLEGINSNSDVMEVIE